MNFWRKGVGWEWIFVIARSLELQALPYALNRPPRAAASFNPGLEVLRRDSHETTEGLPPYQWEWAGRVAVGEGPEADPNLGWSYRPRLRQLAKEQGRGAAWPLMLQVGNLSPGPDGGGLESRQPPLLRHRHPILDRLVGRLGMEGLPLGRLGP